MEEPRDHTATDASTSCDIDDRAVEVGAIFTNARVRTLYITSKIVGLPQSSHSFEW